MTLTWRWIIAVVLVGPALAESYRLAGLVLPTPERLTWMPSAIVNSAIALAIAWWLARSPAAPDAPIARPNNAEHRNVVARWWILPAGVVAIGSTMLAATSSLWGVPERLPLPWEQLAFVLWIPIIEETVFRAGIGRWLRGRLGWMMGAYVSALVFAFVHSEPTLSRVMDGHVGIPLGPLLLGLACEVLYAYSGKLRAPIALHMACNATPAIFASLDARWLVWLGALYSSN